MIHEIFVVYTENVLRIFVIIGSLKVKSVTKKHVLLNYRTNIIIGFLKFYFDL